MTKDKEISKYGVRLLDATQGCSLAGFGFVGASLRDGSLKFSAPSNFRKRDVRTGNVSAVFAVNSLSYVKRKIDTMCAVYYLLYYGGGRMITLRLDRKLEQTINNTAKDLGITKSELIRKSIDEYLGKLAKPSAWNAGQDLFGRHASGLGNLSADRKELVKDKILAKHK